LAKLKKKSKSAAKKSLKPVSVKKAKARATEKKGSTVRKKPVKRTAAVKRTSAQRLAPGAGEAGASLVGEKATTMIRPATGGKNISLQDFKGSRVVIYFYPKDNTPGCTVEGQDFKRLKSEFAAKNTVVLGVSKDSMKSHESFKEKCGFPFDLLVDEDESFCRSFDVIKLKKLYGREFMGIERSTFVIDEEGLILKEWRKVKVDGHADEVLEFIGTLD
jgi:peroxiredoxin Q/BCP